MNKINVLESLVEDNIVLEKYNTIYNYINTLDTALECIDVLDNIAVPLKNALESDNIVSMASLKLARFSAESVCYKVNLPIQSLSLESFDSNDRLSVEYALETISETVKKIWEGIKSFFIMLMDKLKDFVSYMLKRSKKNSEDLKTVKEKVKDLKENEVTLDLTSFRTIFHITGSNVAYGSITDILDNQHKITVDIDHVNGELLKYIEVIARNSYVVDYREIGKLFDTIIKDIKKDSKSIFIDSIILEVTSTPNGINDIETKEVSVSDSINLTECTLSLSEVSKIIDKAERLNKILINLEENNGDPEKVLKNYVDYIQDKIISRADDPRSPALNANKVLSSNIRNIYAFYNFKMHRMSGKTISDLNRLLGTI